MISAILAIANIVWLAAVLMAYAFGDASLGLALFSLVVNGAAAIIVLRGVDTHRDT